MEKIPDIQSGVDNRQIAIQRVGICGLRQPLVVETAKSTQHTIVTAAMTVALPHQQKGTHMSRFVQLLGEQQSLSLTGLGDLHRAMLQRLKAEHGTIQLDFTYFVHKTAPVSQVVSALDYQVQWLSDGGEKPDLYVTVTATVTSLCPCSKEISQYGAHNQRSHIIIKALYNPAQPFTIEELIRVAEEASSCEIWPTLKRPDEKYVTERAYENPKFVEDIVRDVALVLNADKRVAYYRVSSENFESIHNHNAYAVVECDKR